MMRRFLLSLTVCLLAAPLLGQQQATGTGQLFGRDQQVSILFCRNTSTTAALPPPALPCHRDSSDLITTYTTSGLSTPNAQPLTVAGGAQWNAYIPTGTGVLRMSVCPTAEVAATATTDVVYATGCETAYVNPSCASPITNVAGQIVCGPAPATVPAVPGSGLNTLVSNSGGLATWQARTTSYTARNSTFGAYTVGTGVSQVIASVTIPAGAVQPGGKLTLDGFCNFTGTLAAVTVVLSNTTASATLQSGTPSVSDTDIAFLPMSLSAIAGDTASTQYSAGGVVSHNAATWTFRGYASGIGVNTFYVGNTSTAYTYGITWAGAATESIRCTLNAVVSNP